MNIGVDFDDVLYPYHAFLKERLRQRFGVDLSRHKVTTFYYEQHPLLAAKGVTRDQVWQEVQATWDEVDSHDEADLLDPQAPAVLQRLAGRHRITIVTARTSASRPHVQRFLARHEIHPKDVRFGQGVKAGFDVLVDDFPKHALENAQSGGYSILYTIDENSTFDESRFPRIHRVGSWREVEATVDRIQRGRRARG